MRVFITAALIVLSAAAAAVGQADIRKIDFKNFTYDAYCASDTTEKVTVKDGEFFKETQELDYVDRFYFQVFGVSYGDLNGDGADEAIALTVCNTGGTGNFSEGHVFTLKSGKPSKIAYVPGGDRAYGGLRSSQVENGLLVVESNDVGENGGACCPEFVVTNRYRLQGGRLIEVGTAERRELYPAERVTFAKGTSGKTFKVTIPAQELKRLVVGARAGQTLTVSIDTDKASLRLLQDASVTEGANNFLARLPKNGDYTIEIQNFQEIDAEITVNIKIR